MANDGGNKLSEEDGGKGAGCLMPDVRQTPPLRIRAIWALKKVEKKGDQVWGEREEFEKCDSKLVGNRVVGLGKINKKEAALVHVVPRAKGVV